MLPKDPDILIGVINMKLRDFYPSLDDLCDREDESKSEIEQRLGNAGWRYDKALNTFIKKGEK